MTAQGTSRGFVEGRAGRDAAHVVLLARRCRRVSRMGALTRAAPATAPSAIITCIKVTLSDYRLQREFTNKCTRKHDHVRTRV